MIRLSGSVKLRCALSRGIVPYGRPGPGGSSSRSDGRFRKSLIVRWSGACRPVAAMKSTRSSSPKSLSDE